ncbi:DNA replication and repair protein RecF [Candidatus Gottesmanbacteria bacterium]|nr:DNA replication and repair protein RecF [Candidatus Gottesmanbacteria bacterium]
MIVGEIALQNFRSYTKKTFQFSPQTTLIVGPNAAGKTNILEAIFLMATGKSFRADQDREVVRWEAEVGRIKSQITNHNDQTNLELVITSGEVQGEKTPLKKFLVNGVPRRMIDFVGNLRVVLFWPEDLELVTDSPSLRRRYLDSVLVQVDREYRRNLLSYERGLRQRNRLLDFINEETAHRHQLLFWDQLLIKAGGYLTEKRAQFIEFINTYHVSHITYHITYDKSVISESRLAQYAGEEVAAKATLVGPHRDDFVAFKDTRELSKFGSRGEQRLAILWLKLAELAYIEKAAGERPVLLLDDIFSELDDEHRALVFDLIGKQQTIITSADEHAIPATIRKKMQVIELGL